MAATPSNLFSWQHARRDDFYDAVFLVFSHPTLSDMLRGFRVLNLPPKSGNLEATLRALTGPSTMYANLITEIVHHVTTGQHRELDRDDAYDYFLGYYRHNRALSSPLESETEHDPQRIWEDQCYSANIAMYENQIKAQDKFADELGNPRKLNCFMS
jgi:hypothetical protein